MKKITENTKVTLTLGQIRRLVKESMRIPRDFDVQHEFEKWLAKEKKLEFGSFFDFVAEEVYHMDRDENVHLDSETSREFYGTCDRLERKITVLNIPEGVTKISFLNMADGSQFPRLKTLTIPKSVKVVDCWTHFLGTLRRLTNVDRSVEDGLVIDGWLLFPWRNENVADFSKCNLRGIADGVFQRWPGRKVILPKSIKEIPDYMFWNCKNLRELVAPGATKVSNEFSNTPVVRRCKVVSARAGGFEFEEGKDMYRLALRWSDGDTSVMLRDKRTGEVWFKVKPKAGLSGNPKYVTFSSKEDAQKFIEAFLADNSKLRLDWKRYGVIYKLSAPWCNHPHTEVSTEYGNCLIPEDN